MSWPSVVEACRGGGDCDAAIAEFLRKVCESLVGRCGGRRGRVVERYAWIEDVIERGVPDGRSRLILYVISRYLVNVKGLSPGEAEPIIDAFLDASCRNHGNCEKIYKSWIRHVLKRVAEGGWKPWSLERIKREDPELYSVLAGILGLK